MRRLRCGTVTTGGAYRQCGASSYKEQYPLLGTRFQHTYAPASIFDTKVAGNNVQLNESKIVTRISKKSSLLNRSQPVTVARHLHTPNRRMAESSLTTKLTLPNGVSYEQPLGLFINNEFVKPSKEQEMIEVLDPSYVPLS